MDSGLVEEHFLLLITSYVENDDALSLICLALVSLGSRVVFLFSSSRRRCSGPESWRSKQCRASGKNAFNGFGAWGVVILHDDPCKMIIFPPDHCLLGIVSRVVFLVFYVGTAAPASPTTIFRRCLWLF